MGITGIQDEFVPLGYGSNMIMTPMKERQDGKKMTQKQLKNLSNHTEAVRNIISIFQSNSA